MIILSVDSEIQPNPLKHFAANVDTLITANAN